MASLKFCPQSLAWRVEELRNELERENEWDDKVVEMLNGLEEKIRADGQRSLNDQFIL
ncbi:MAG: hypothetical protein O7198_03250 [Wolbachia endosymbiont of Nomada marshamella]|nr:hypothetical protein [Wolbachia endosymbiont of Nomada marshamella]